MSKHRAKVIAVLALSVMIFATFVLYLIFEPAITTTYSESQFSHDASRNVVVNISCEYGYAPKHCAVNVINTTGDKVNLTVKTVVTKSSEYKGNEKVYDYFRKDVQFREDDGTLYIDVKIIGGSTMFMLRSPWAGVDVCLPEGTSYRIIEAQR